MFAKLCLTGRYYVWQADINIHPLCQKHLYGVEEGRSRETLISAPSRWHLSSKMNTTKWPFSRFTKGEQISRRIANLDENKLCKNNNSE